MKPSADKQVVLRAFGVSGRSELVKLLFLSMKHECFINLTQGGNFKCLRSHQNTDNNSFRGSETCGASRGTAQ